MVTKNSLLVEKRRTKTLPVQLKYAMILTLMAAFFSLGMISVMGWFIQRNYNLFLGDELGLSAQVIQVVKHEQRLLEFSLFLLFLTSTTCMFAVTLLITRKLTGPMIALQRHLRLFSEGDWSTEFRLRKKDEFQELEPLMRRLRKAHLDEIHIQDEKQQAFS